MEATLAAIRTLPPFLGVAAKALSLNNEAGRALAAPKAEVRLRNSRRVSPDGHDDDLVSYGFGMGRSFSHSQRDWRYNAHPNRLSRGPAREREFVDRHQPRPEKQPLMLAV